MTLLTPKLIALSLAALCWFIAAAIPTPLPAYLSNAPDWVGRRLRLQLRMNAVGALLAAIGMALEAYSVVEVA